MHSPLDDRGNQWNRSSLQSIHLQCNSPDAIVSSSSYSTSLICGYSRHNSVLTLRYTVTMFAQCYCAENKNNTHTHTRTHARTHTHARKHAHARTHTISHARISFLFPLLVFFFKVKLLAALLGVCEIRSV